MNSDAVYLSAWKVKKKTVAGNPIGVVLKDFLRNLRKCTSGKRL